MRQYRYCDNFKQQALGAPAGVRLETWRRAKYCKTLIHPKSRGNASGSIYEFEVLNCRRRTGSKIGRRHGIRHRPNVPDWQEASSFQGGGRTHDQVGEPLRILWGKIWSGFPPTLEAALLPQGLQGQLPCKKGEGLCAHEKVVKLPISRNISLSARMSRLQPPRRILIA